MPAGPGARDDLETIPLLRGGGVVSSFLGAFGTSLKETRLTAALGYVMSLKPRVFADLFGFRGSVVSVSLEAGQERDRVDILFVTSRGTGVIEAKLDPIDPFMQAFKYQATWRVLLTDYVPSQEHRARMRVRYFRLNEIAQVLKHLSRSTGSPLKFLCSDLVRYLEDKNMIRNRESVEIYAREINEEVTLAFFLKARMYGCNYEASSRVQEALYFAPHFGRSIANAYPGVTRGVSYVAKIEIVEPAETWKDLLELVTSIRGKTWLKSNIKYLESIHRTWKWPVKRNFLFLGDPRLVFNPAIRKDDLQKGKGWLSKRTFSFDDLFSALAK